MKGDRTIDQDGAISIQHARPDVLVIWTVYAKPKDYPNEFVARPTAIDDGKPEPLYRVLRAKTLNEVRAQLPPGLICTARHPDDDHKIVETWM